MNKLDSTILRQTSRDMAEVVLVYAGWNNTIDIDKLAARLADTVQDFIADLEEDE